MFESLKSKTILITGASSGIGSSIAKEYIVSTSGQIKLILASRRIGKIESQFNQYLIDYPNLQIYIGQLDVSSKSSRLKFWDEIPTSFKNIDILINNAGIALGSEFIGSLDEQDVETVYNTNVLGMIGMTQLALSHMKPLNCGDIVQIGSIAGRETYPSGSIYCSTKAAVKSFTDTLRKELINTSIRVLEIAPGNTMTDFSLNRSKGDIEKSELANKGFISLKSKDIAEIVVFATSRDENVVMAEVVVMASAQAGPNHLHRSE